MSIKGVGIYMSKTDEYTSLVQDFEQGLGRKLTDKEEELIKWMVEQLEASKPSQSTKGMP